MSMSPSLRTRVRRLEAMAAQSSNTPVGLIVGERGHGMTPDQAAQARRETDARIADAQARGYSTFYVADFTGSPRLDPRPGSGCAALQEQSPCF